MSHSDDFECPQPGNIFGVYEVVLECRKAPHLGLDYMTQGVFTSVKLADQCIADLLTSPETRMNTYHRWLRQAVVTEYESVVLLTEDALTWVLDETPQAREMVRLAQVALRKHKALRDSALSKLTAEERQALGI